MISRIFRSLQVLPRAFYSTQPKQNVVVVPKRHEVTFNQFSELEGYIKVSLSCKALAALVKVTDFSLRITSNTSLTTILTHFSIISDNMILLLMSHSIL
jgi:hypothetical protein